MLILTSLSVYSIRCYLIFSNGVLYERGTESFLGGSLFAGAFELPACYNRARHISIRSVYGREYIRASIKAAAY